MTEMKLNQDHIACAVERIMDAARQGKMLVAIERIEAVNLAEGGALWLEPGTRIYHTSAICHSINGYVAISTGMAEVTIFPRHALLLDVVQEPESVDR